MLFRSQTQRDEVKEAWLTGVPATSPPPVTVAQPKPFAPPSSTKPLKEQTQIVISSRSKTGTALGPAKKGQRLHIQYVDGLWITAGTKLVSPDNAPHQYAKVVVIGVAEGKEEVVMIVPSGTKARPFSDALKKDYEQVFLRINDDVKSDNSGEVTYKATIK